MSEPVEAGAPSSVVDTSRSSFLVRRYYDVWTAPALSTAWTRGLGCRRRERGRAIPVRRVPRRDRGRRFRAAVVLGPRHAWRRPTRCSRSPPRARSRALIRVKTRSRLGVLQLDEIYGPAEIDTSSGSSRRRALFELARQPRFWVSIAIYSTIRSMTHWRATRARSEPVTSRAGSTTRRRASSGMGEVATVTRWSTRRRRRAATRRAHPRDEPLGAARSEGVARGAGARGGGSTGVGDLPEGRIRSRRVRSCPVSASTVSGLHRRRSASSATSASSSSRGSGPSA